MLKGLTSQFTKQVMKSGIDYGVIPGTGQKPTLFKPGAEKLTTLFKLSPSFLPLQSITDFDKGFFYFQYQCDLRDQQGNLVGSGIGSCNSKEKKYRYRNIYENKATEAEKAAAVRVDEKTGKYGPYKVYVIENTEPFDQVNTFDKMAQKRALVAATLIAANASEFFTQDIEDLNIVEGEYSVVEPDPSPKPPPPPSQPQGNGPKKNGQPIGVIAEIQAEYPDKEIPAITSVVNRLDPAILRNQQGLAAYKMYRQYRADGLEPDDAIETVNKEFSDG